MLVLGCPRRWAALCRLWPGAGRCPSAGSPPGLCFQIRLEVEEALQELAPLRAAAEAAAHDDAGAARRGRVELASAFWQTLSQVVSIFSAFVLCLFGVGGRWLRRRRKVAA